MNKLDFLPEFSKEYLEECRKHYMESMKNNPNNFSYWFPRIKDCGLNIPRSVVFDIPEDIMNCFFFERPSDSETIKNFFEEKIKPEWKDFFGTSEIFIKNGCFSNKFDFSTCRSENKIEKVIDSFSNIQYKSFMNDTMGNTEMVIREFIEPDEEWSKTIYNGMPLRPEIRVFYDFDEKKVLYSVNYWDWDYCHDRICEDENDKEIYEEVYPKLQDFINLNKNLVENVVNSYMENVVLQGKWSIDMMYSQGKWWLIDMALARQSAYWKKEFN